MTERKVTSSRRWWFESHGGSRRSTWLRSTLSELDNKTEAMLSLIEEDADSFAKRAEMYYKKRPELIAMVEDLYRSHRSLAENYDLLKIDSGTHINLALPFSFKKCASEKSTTDQDSIVDQSYVDYSDTSDLEDEESSEPEVYDPDPEPEIVQVIDDIDRDSMANLREEAERLRGENERQKEELAEKDEEKREVIRQLSMAVEALKDENSRLRRLAAEKKRGRVIEGKNNPKGGFIRMLFKARPSVVAL